MLQTEAVTEAVTTVLWELAQIEMHMDISQKKFYERIFQVERHRSRSSKTWAKLAGGRAVEMHVDVFQEQFYKDRPFTPYRKNLSVWTRKVWGKKGHRHLWPNRKQTLNQRHTAPDKMAAHTWEKKQHQTVHAPYTKKTNHKEYQIETSCLTSLIFVNTKYAKLS